MTVLDRIVDYKRTQELPRRLQSLPMEAMQEKAAAAPPSRDFISALRAVPGVALIAEVKRASPSKGLLRRDFDPVELALAYAANGAAAISVLTDEPFFQGSLASLTEIRRVLDARIQAGPALSSRWTDGECGAGSHSFPNGNLSPRDPTGQVSLPLLRKDFIIHPYQVYEARAAGADALLLIAAILPDDDLRDLLDLTGALGMTALVEVHTREEVERVLPTSPRLIGVNNRDLRDFRVDLQTCLALRPAVPPRICFVAESGIYSRADMERLAAAGVDAALVGEALVMASDVGAKVRELVDGRQGIHRDRQDEQDGRQG